MAKAKTKQKQSSPFQLKEIKLLNVSLSHPKKILPEQITFHFYITLEHRIHIEKKLVFVVTSINISDEKAQETLLGTISTICSFEITNLNDFLDKDKKRATFPDELLVILNSTAISTTRGVMFSQFKGTFLHRGYLPIIDPKIMKMDYQK